MTKTDEVIQNKYVAKLNRPIKIVRTYYKT